MAGGALIWVKIARPTQIVAQRGDQRGRPINVHPGDWVEVTVAKARQLIEQGMAKAVRPNDMLFDTTGCGIVAYEVGSTRGFEGIDALIAAEPEYRLIAERTAFWSNGLAVTRTAIEAGLELLTRWDAALLLVGYDTVAADVGTADERERTARVCGGDLRQMLYDPRLMFVRRGTDGEALIAAFAAERDGGDDRLALLRAVWRVKPRLTALPPTWTG